MSSDNLIYGAQFFISEWDFLNREFFVWPWKTLGACRAFARLFKCFAFVYKNEIYFRVNNYSVSLAVYKTDEQLNINCVTFIHIHFPFHFPIIFPIQSTPPFLIHSRHHFKPILKTPTPSPAPRPSRMHHSSLSSLR